MTDTVNVPRVATREMLIAGRMDGFFSSSAADAVYNAMLAAAPKGQPVEADGWFGSGWYDLGGKRHARPDLITGEQLDMNKVSEGPFNLYRHPAPSSDELLSVIIELVEHFERVDGDAEHKALIEKATKLYAKHKGPQS